MVDVHLKPIFPINFGYVNLGEGARHLNKILVRNTDEQHNKYQTTTEKRTFSKNKLSWRSINGLEKHYDSFKALGEIITDVAKPIVQEDNIECRTLWVNKIMHPGGFSQPHTHLNGDRVIFTGVYYPYVSDENGNDINQNLDNFDIDKNITYGSDEMDGHIVLVNPNRIYGLMGNQTNPYENLVIKPRESLLLLFPIWLEHWVAPTVSNMKRYSISFGIVWKRNLHNEDVTEFLEKIEQYKS